MANKVEFGLSNVHYALWNSETSEYATPVAIPGAVSFSCDPEGDSSTFYADNIAYVVFSTNGGYSGSIEFAKLPTAARKALLGEAEDANGLIYEVSTAQPAEFALLFKFEGDQSATWNVLYNVKLERGSEEHNTREDSTDPDTRSFDFTAIGRDMTVGGATMNVVKAYVEDTSATAYASFTSAVQVPTA